MRRGPILLLLVILARARLHHSRWTISGSRGITINQCIQVIRDKIPLIRFSIHTARSTFLSVNGKNKTFDSEFGGGGSFLSLLVSVYRILAILFYFRSVESVLGRFALLWVCICLGAQDVRAFTRLSERKGCIASRGFLPCNLQSAYRTLCVGVSKYVELSGMIVINKD